MPRVLIICLGILALAAPAASATTYAANPSNAQSMIDAATSNPGQPNVVTLAAGTYTTPLHVLTHNDLVTIIGAGGGTVLQGSLTVASGPTSVRLLQLVGALAVAADTNTTTLRVDNTVIRGSVSRSGGSSSVSIVLRQVTQYSPPPSLSASSGSTTFTLFNSILSSAPGTLAGSIFCSYSGIPAFTNPTGSRCDPSLDNNTLNPVPVENLFVNAPGGDLHLRAGSAAIDRGSADLPDQTIESMTDLDGNPRDVPYANCTTPLRDLGAYEVPTIAHAPSVSITGPATSNVGDTALFQMTGPDASTVVDAQWRFSDGGTGSGPQVQHTWLAAGRPTMTLTAKTSGGCRSVVNAIVTVLVPDKTPPVVTLAKLTPKAFKSGSKPKLSLTLSEASTITATVYRRDIGVRKSGKCLAKKKGRKGKACKRYTGISHAAFNLPAGKSSLRLPLPKLKAGHYRLVLSSVDPSKNKGKPVNVGFDIRKS